MIKTIMFAFIALAACCAAAAATPALSPGAAKLEQLNKSLNAAKVIRFKAIVKIAGDPKKQSAVLLVQGIVQGPNLLKVVAVDPLKNSINGDQLSCDGKSYIASSDALDQYSRADAPKDSFEPDSPPTMHFIYGVIGDAGRAILNASEQFFPADFNIADDSEPAGMTRKIVIKIVPVVVNGRKCEDVQQRLTTLHGAHIIHTVIDKENHQLVQCGEDSVKDGKARSVISITYLSLDLGKTKLPASAFSNALDPKMQAYVAPASPGMTAPEFTVSKRNGTQVHLSDFRGKVVLIDFWATWCGPCRVTLPDTNKMAAKYERMGVVFLPVCTWDTKKDFDGWVAKHSSWYLSWLFDPAGLAEDDSIASKLYAVSAIPTQYVVGKDGKITYVCFADTDAGQKPVVDALKKAIAAQPVASVN